jgi:hydroxymethylbilane synthase
VRVVVANTIRIGTRSSRLARWQANWVGDRLQQIDPESKVELVEIKTLGDRDRNLALAAGGGAGLFTKEIQRALQDNLVDVAVHSLKDLPTQEPADLKLAAIPLRDDVADALIAPVHRTLDALPLAARVGTSSPRRRAQLLWLRPDLDIVTLRGNVEARLKRVVQGELDAVVLAWAGLRRLGLAHFVTQRLEPPQFLPAAGQGALAVECRRNHESMLGLLGRLDDPVALRAVRAERVLLAELQAGCAIPLAAWARDIEDTETPLDRPELALDAALFSPDGRTRIAAALRGPREDPDNLGHCVARALRDQGASLLLNGLR